ncbi:hypothetical protein KJ966_26770 [bacterium]|nr:hypothetical protein [bacterium]
MGNRIEDIKNFENIIKNQRTLEPTSDEIKTTIKLLECEHLVEYVKFLEVNYKEKLNANVGTVILKKMGIDDEEFIGQFAAKINVKRLERLERLVKAKSDRLLDTYLNIMVPDEILNKFVLLKANLINYEYDGKYRNALVLIRLAVELNEVEKPEDLFDTFLKMENNYYNKNYPSVDVNTFYKLVIPMLRKYSVKCGPEAFYELRDKVILELRKHGVTPNHLSIDVLDRRGKHRTKQLNLDDYQGFELY